VTLTPYQKIKRAAEAGRGVKLTATECWQLMQDDAIAQVAEADGAARAEPCWCDKQGIGEPGVSCGDCPTRDYKRTAGVNVGPAPQPAAWLTQSGNPVRADEHDASTAAVYGWKPLYRHPPTTGVKVDAPRKPTAVEVAEWAERHDLRGSATDLRCAFEDAASLHMADGVTAAPVTDEQIDVISAKTEAP
jgi:hypothetical protein